MKKNEKKEITDRLATLDFEGDLENTIAYLKKTMKDFKKLGYSKFSVDKETEYGYGCDDSYDVYHLMGVRLETDEEFSKRIETSKKKSIAAKKAAKTRAIKKEEREHAKYLELHAKFKGK